MSYIKLLPKTTVKIRRSDKFLGSGVLVTVDGRFYVITALHVVADQDGCSVTGAKLLELIYESEVYGDLKFVGLVGSPDAQEKYDIVAIEVGSEKISDFPNTRFCSDVSFPDVQFIVRGTAKSETLSPHSIPRCEIDTIIENEKKFHLRIPSDDYSTAQGESGAEVLQGYSGSGVFFKDSEEFWLAGIVLSVENNNFNGLVCRSVSALEGYFFDCMELDDYHGGNKNTRVSVSELRASITEQLIEERKNKGYGDVENLVRKMEAFLPGWTTEDLDQFIVDILLWERLDRKYIRTNEQYRSLVEDAKVYIASGNKKFSVGTPHQGNIKFHKIQEEFMGHLNELLDGSPLKMNSRIIVSGELAKMLANCSLDFWSDHGD
ncbi:hypothetical protein [Marinobacter manganoxydans]|uniref:Trypsin-like peptidase domain-containing protein n=1 Tax=Marinobacter manganoxydans MnI7-9 TaxID=1094979 RepID=G6YWB3_9GAMM|nr:hypothetical protein [Marinobacter manganoxydans]EHJ03307.1 hypothetical protein KYE_15863 [Marinobacter manganoxydans MnI7-9]PTB94552.1 hypothetical protein C9974_03965 [Marinobacter sp. B9-2]